MTLTYGRYWPIMNSKWINWGNVRWYKKEDASVFRHQFWRTTIHHNMKSLFYGTILIVAFCSVQGMDIFVALICQYVSFYLNKFIKQNIKKIFNYFDYLAVQSFGFELHHEGYCRNWSCALNLISTFLFKGYDIRI